MTPLRQRMLEDMGIRNFAENAQLSYLQQIAAYARHFGRSPEDLGPEDVRAYQVHLVEVRQLAPASVGIATSALRFLYKVTLKRNNQGDQPRFHGGAGQGHRTATGQSVAHQWLNVFDAVPFWGAFPAGMHARRWSWQPSSESIDVDRSRKVRFARTARKPAPILVLHRLTVKMTVKIFEAAASALQLNSLEGSLMLEWERGSPGRSMSIDIDRGVVCRSGLSSRVRNSAEKCRAARGASLQVDTKICARLHPRLDS